MNWVLEITSAVIISGCALGFTVGSFWYQNIRRGELRAFEPHTFGATVTTRLIRLRLPLVFYNDGARPIVVRGMRLHLAYDTTLITVPWNGGTKSRLMPEEGDHLDLPAAFPVEGRKALQVFAEFSITKSPPDVHPVEYTAHLEVMLDEPDHWIELLIFPLRAGNILEPSSFIAYGNAEDEATIEERAAAKSAFERVLEAKSRTKSAE
ncbi:hypothetical protein ACFWY5_31945 [Nonomuraea sp. NPDC059007]|uniref:hypothetical protein n=1 Tax=Nonomuraea sp. NPDC059007 TaxID=3346692 RepID=UPI0036ADB4A6